MKLFLAAPESGFPLLPMALSLQHFFIKLVLAAPASGLPSLPTALFAQDWAIADATAKDVIRAAKAIRFIVLSIFRPSIYCSHL